MVDNMRFVAAVVIVYSHTLKLAHIWDCTGVYVWVWIWHTERERDTINWENQRQR